MGLTPPYFMAAPPEVYQQRRARLAEALRRPLVVFAGHAPARNYAANAYRFRPGSSYTYFGGPPVPHAAWLIAPGSDGDHGCTLFRPPATQDDAIWNGNVAQDGSLTEAAGLRASGVRDLESLEEQLAGRTAGAVIPPFPETMALAQRLRLQPAGDEALRAIIDLRLRKDAHELTAMRRAAEVTVRAHRAAMAATRVGRREADVAGVYASVLTAHECAESFSKIITVRGHIFHLEGHPNELRDGNLLVIDAGAEEPTGYACDITRTLPVSGTWTRVQRELYEVVHWALRTAVEACTPGMRYRDIHDLAAKVICEGLVQADLLKGNPIELVERRAHTLFFPHGVGHLIGLDVHDMEDFGDLAGYAPGRTRRTQFGDAYLRLDRDLDTGMCVTIEPGIYLAPAIWANEELVRPFADAVNRSRIDALLRDQFGGIRIEHTVCVRDASGPEVLSAALPTAADEVAALVGGG